MIGLCYTETLFTGLGGLREAEPSSTGGLESMGRQLRNREVFGASHASLPISAITYRVSQNKSNSGVADKEFKLSYHNMGIYYIIGSPYCSTVNLSSLTASQIRGVQL